MRILQVTQAEYNQQGTLIYALKQELESAVERRELERVQGDLSENASFEAACKDIKRLSSQIRKEEDKYRHMHIVQGGKGIAVGCSIVVTDPVRGCDMQITIVGSNGNPPYEVSKDSLFGQAAFGKTVGDVIAYNDRLHRKQTFVIKEIK